MSDQAKPVKVLQTELNRMLERLVSNYDLSYAEVIGVLTIKIAQLANKAIK